VAAASSIFALVSMGFQAHLPFIVNLHASPSDFDGLQLVHPPVAGLGDAHLTD
jgi:hypothetical protein